MILKENIINISNETKLRIFDLPRDNNKGIDFFNEVSDGEGITKEQMLASRVWQDEFFVLLFVNAILHLDRIHLPRLPNMTG